MVSSIPPISPEHHYYAPLKPEPATAPPLQQRNANANAGDSDVTNNGPQSSVDGVASVIDTTA
jgi:hypothetical protein